MSGDFNADEASDIGQTSEDNEYTLPTDDIYTVLRNADLLENRCNEDETPDRNFNGKNLLETCSNANDVTFNG